MKEVRPWLRTAAVLLVGVLPSLPLLALGAFLNWALFVPGLFGTLGLVMIAFRWDDFDSLVLRRRRSWWGLG